MFGAPLQFDKFSSAGLEHHSLFFALVKELLLALGQSSVIGDFILFLSVDEEHVFGACVHSLVSLAVNKIGVERRPRGHQKLLFGGIDINNAILILHKVLEARSCVENWRDRHG